MIIPLHCSGCSGFADRRWIFDSLRGICTRCAQTINCFDRTESADDCKRDNGKCLGCGETTYHGIHMCFMCREDILSNMEYMWGVDLWQDNPFIYWLNEPTMMFGSTLGLEYPEFGFDWAKLWINQHMDSGISVIECGLRYVSFKGLYEKMKLELDKR